MIPTLPIQRMEVLIKREVMVVGMDQAVVELLDQVQGKMAMRGTINIILDRC